MGRLACGSSRVKNRANLVLDLALGTPIPQQDLTQQLILGEVGDVGDGNEFADPTELVKGPASNPIHLPEMVGFKDRRNNRSLGGGECGHEIHVQ